MSLSTAPRALAVAVLVGASLLVATPATGQTTPPVSGQQGLVASLRGRSDGPVQVDTDPTTGAVTFVGTRAGSPVTSTTEASGGAAAAAGAFVADFGTLFGASSAADLERESVEPRVDGGATVHYQQVEGGVPVLAGELNIQVNEHGDVLSALGELAPRLDVAATPTVTATAAAGTAVEAVAKADGVDAATLSPSAPEPWVYAPDLLGGPTAGTGSPRLVWRLEVTGPGTDEPVRELVLIDATTGGVALHFNQIAANLSRKVCNFNNVVEADETCTAPFARVEGQGATGNADVDKAFDFAGDTYEFFDTRFGRDSLDDAGLELRSTVKYCPSPGECPFQNAFWNGSQMTYGDGFASADDVVGHELAHGYTEFTSGLFYYFQSGAINESMSDVFGEFIDQTNGAGNDAPGVRWQMGEDLPVFGVIRNMADPTIFGHPDRMGSTNYTLGLNDSGGVHSNSGVNNKAAFLMVDGATFNGHTVPALGITRTARIYDEVETTLLTSGSDYADLGRALVQACNNVVGVDGITGATCAGVQQAVDATQMTSVNPAAAPAPEAPGCPGGTLPSTVFSDNLENTGSGNWTRSPASGNRWAYPQNPNAFGFDATYATSGDTNFFGPDFDSSSDTSIARTASVVLPANSILVFNHAYDLENNFDGGTVELSTNNGASFTDAGPLFTANGYNGTINTGSTPAFTSRSNGYRSSQVNLASLAGQSVRFRFRLRTDLSVSALGWFIDDVRILSCNPPAGRPDAQIRIGATGTFVGDDIYNTTGTGQTRSTTVGGGDTATFYARIQNDGNVTEPVKVKGPAGNTRFDVTYFAGAADITSQVVAGTYQTAPLAPGAKTNIKVVVKVRSGAPIGATVTLKIKATSTTTTTAKDAVKATVTRNH